MPDQIRPARPKDAVSIAAIYAPYVLETAISFEDAAPSAKEMARRMTATAADFPFLVFERDGDVLGYAYAGAHAARAAYRWSVNTTVYVAAHAHGSGIGRALYADLLDRLTRQGFHAAFAGIALPNERSVRLHEAVGFRHLGTYEQVGFKFGGWHDVGWWRRALNEGPPLQDPLPATP